MLTKQIFAKRRRKLLNAMPANSIAIIPSGVEFLRNGDAHYLFRQNSDFYYLTGFMEPEAVAILCPGRPEGEYVLFNRERHLEVEIWEGARAGQEGACRDFGADQAFSIDTLDAKANEFLQKRERVFCMLGNQNFSQRIMTWINQLRAQVRSGVAPPSEMVDITRFLHEQRLFKDEDEIALMRKAAEISACAHVRAMQACKPGMMEYQLAAELMYEFLHEGCESVAYNSIVASGPNACVLHYVNNNRQVQKDDLVLIDAAGEYQYYAADITRTFPASGRFSKEQRAIYDIVLAAQEEVIRQIKPGLSWNKLQETAIRVITEGLIELGILKGKAEDIIAKQAFRPFYMHNIGHWLGLDVHDAGQYKVEGEWRLLQPGMVFTVEPGIYIRPGDDVAEKWWNIGVRIEDDVLVTKQGCEIFSKGVPKKADEIEKIMKK